MHRVILYLAYFIIAVSIASAEQVNESCIDNCKVWPSVQPTVFVHSIPSNWDVAVRFDVANFGPIYAFGQPLAVGESRFASLGASDSTVEWIPYCYTGCGWRECDWAEKARQRCLNLGLTCSELYPEKTGCMCYQGVISAAKPHGWYVERKKVDENRYYLLVRGVSEADCHYSGHGYVRGEVWLNPDSRWRITEVNDCRYKVDRNGGRPAYCEANETAVRFASGSGCIGCCACEDSGYVRVNVTVERNRPYIEWVKVEPEIPEMLEEYRIIVSVRNPSDETVTLTLWCNETGLLEGYDDQLLIPPANKSQTMMIPPGGNVTFEFEYKHYWRWMKPLEILSGAEGGSWDY